MWKNQTSLLGWFSRKAAGGNGAGSFISMHFTCVDVTHLLLSPAPMPPPVMWILSVRWRKRNRGTKSVSTLQMSQKTSSHFEAFWLFCCIKQDKWDRGDVLKWEMATARCNPNSHIEVFFFVMPVLSLQTLLCKQASVKKQIRNYSFDLFFLK